MQPVRPVNWNKLWIAAQAKRLLQNFPERNEQETVLWRLLQMHAVNKLTRLHNDNTPHVCWQRTSLSYFSDCESHCPDQVLLCFCVLTSCLLLFLPSPADHAACHPGADASQTHPRGRRGHSVLQVQTVLQRHAGTVHIHRSVQRSQHAARSKTQVSFLTFVFINVLSVCVCVWIVPMSCSSRWGQTVSS